MSHMEKEREREKERLLLLFYSALMEMETGAREQSPFWSCRDGTAEYHPCLAEALGRQLYRDGRAVTLPLRWSEPCQRKSMVPGIELTQPLAKAITLHPGLEG